MAYLTRAQVDQLGLRACGEDVLISDRCALHGAEHISIGNHVRIDDFAIITARAEVRIGSHVHVAAGVFVSGQFGVTLFDFSGLSPHVVVLSGNDDFSGATLTGPTIPQRFRGISGGPVTIGRHVIVGAGSVVLSNLTVGDGTTIGALSLVNRSLDPWSIYAGVPTRFIRKRSRNLLQLEAQLLAERDES